MNDPFFQYHISQIRRQQPSPPPPPQSSKTRLELDLKLKSTTKIQKLFRGYRVRKTVKKILDIKRQVDDVENSLFEGDKMEIIRENKFERLKVTEALMALLFKLDSISSINSGVRVLRKVVITKAIMLQEILDAAINGDVHNNHDDLSEVSEKFGDETVGNYADLIKVSEKFSDETLGDYANLIKVSEKFSDETLGSYADLIKLSEKFSDECNYEDLIKVSEKFDDETLGNCEDLIKNSEKFGDETLGKDDDEMQVKKLNSDVEAILDDDARNSSGMQVDYDDDNGESCWECVGDETEGKKSGFEVGDDNGGGDNRECGRNEEWFVVEGSEGEKEDKEKLAGDNKRLMAMVVDLSKKNEMQTRLICSLAKRVEELEKAMSDKLTRKKKKMECNEFLA